MEKQVTYSLDKRYTELSAEIEDWLLQFPRTEEHPFSEMLNQKQEELNQSFQKWLELLPVQQKDTFLEVLDQLVIQLSNFVHKGSKCYEVEQKILVEGRLFYSELATINDMQHVPFNQLEYIEEKFKSKYRLYALMQGGAAGLGHPLMLALDFPAQLIINLKLIQHIAGIYGYTLRSPREQILALQLLYAATLPQTYRQNSWEWVIAKIRNEHDENQFFYEQDSLIQQEWLETLAKQLLKSFLLLGLRKTSRKGISFLGVLLGANTNYTFTKQAAQFVSYFYRYRFLQERVYIGSNLE